MSKFGPFALSSRERSRLAWRAAANAAARAWAGTEKCRNYAGCVDWLADVSDRPIRRRRFLIGPPAYAPHEEADALTAALAAPRPWRSARKPDPRNHYSRRHRRACRRCDMYRRTMAVVRCAKRYPLLVNAGFYEREAAKWRRDPHGRSGR